MKKIEWKILILTVTVCLMPILGGIVYYDKLPDQVAIHFDLYGNPDNYWHKSAFVVGIPIFMAIIQILCCLTSDLCDEEKEANKKAVSVFKLLIPIITCVLFMATIKYALGINIDIRKIVCLLLGILFIATGNYVPKTKGSYVVHVQRTPNEKLNKKIAKITGYSFIILGIFLMVSAFCEKLITVTAIVFLLEIILLIAISIRAGIEYKKSDNKE